MDLNHLKLEFWKLQPLSFYKLIENVVVNYGVNTLIEEFVKLSGLNLK